MDDSMRNKVTNIQNLIQNLFNNKIYLMNVKRELENNKKMYDYTNDKNQEIDKSQIFFNYLFKIMNYKETYNQDQQEKELIKLDKELENLEKTLGIQKKQYLQETLLKEDEENFYPQKINNLKNQMIEIIKGNTIEIKKYLEEYNNLRQNTIKPLVKIYEKNT
jgi:hypothetical protein